MTGTYVEKVDNQQTFDEFSEKCGNLPGKNMSGRTIAMSPKYNLRNRTVKSHTQGVTRFDNVAKRQLRNYIGVDSIREAKKALKLPRNMSSSGVYNMLHNKRTNAIEQNHFIETGVSKFGGYMVNTIFNVGKSHTPREAFADVRTKMYTLLTKAQGMNNGPIYVWSRAVLHHGERVLNMSNKSLVLRSDRSVNRYLDACVTRMINEYDAYLDGYIEDLMSTTGLYINNFEIHISKAPKGGTFVDLPKHVSTKKACINVLNNKKGQHDNLCFMYACLSSLVPNNTPHANLVSTVMKHENKLDFSMFQAEDFPMHVHNEKIAQFEDANKVNVEVFQECDDGAFELITDTNIDGRTSIRLLLYDGHYVFIKSLSRLLGKSGVKTKHCNICNISFRSKTTFEKHVAKCFECEAPKAICMTPKIKHTYTCKACNGAFTSMKDYENHTCTCENQSEGGIGMVHEKEIPTVKFKKHIAMNEHPVSICADFEALNIPSSQGLTRKRGGLEANIEHIEKCMANHVKSMEQDKKRLVCLTKAIEKREKMVEQRVGFRNGEPTKKAVTELEKMKTDHTKLKEEVDTGVCEEHKKMSIMQKMLDGYYTKLANCPKASNTITLATQKAASYKYTISIKEEFCTEQALERLGAKNIRLIDGRWEISHMYVGVDAHTDLLKSLRSCKSFIKEALIYKQQYSKPELTHMEEEQFRLETTCRYCGLPPKQDECLVRDHCHRSGLYRGPACNSCNLHIKEHVIHDDFTPVKKGEIFVPPAKELVGEYKGSAFIPVFFHNLTGYDSHFIVQALGEALSAVNDDDNGDVSGNGDVSVVSKSSEKLSLIGWENLKFIDSAAFLGGSLEKLIAGVPDGEKHHLCQLAHDVSVKHDVPLETTSKICNGKGVFCYSWFDSMSKLDDTSLPPCEDWIDNLQKDQFEFNKHLMSKAQYQENMRSCIESAIKNREQACEVWEALGMRSLREYHDLYLEMDVAALADVIQYFRKASLRDYQLDPVYYMGLPGFAWDAMLKMTRVELDLLTDTSMYEFFENGVRGGMSIVVKREATANHKYMGEEYDPNKPSQFIAYYDQNNQYGHAMKEALPHSGYEEVCSSELDVILEELKTGNYDCIAPPPMFATQSSKGMTLEVRLHYPPHLHDDHNDFPAAPVSKTIKEHEISPYNRRILAANGDAFHEGTKLCGTLEDKDHYIIHHSALKCYLQLGLKIEKVYRAVRYTQKPWMREYIEFNQNKRAQMGISDFDKDFYKLMNNAVFGKSMENVRKYTNYKLYNEEKAMKNIASPQCTSTPTLFGTKLFGVPLKPKKHELNKTIAVGQCILDQAKTYMYDFHYNVMKPMYGDKLRLLFTDTDSFCYVIQTDDLYADVKTFAKHMDTSEFPQMGAPDAVTCLHSNDNKKVTGKFKDESIEDGIFNFPVKAVTLRSKQYAIDFYYDKTGIRKCKGIKKAVVAKTLTMQDYTDCLKSGKSVYRRMAKISSTNHEIKVTLATKKALGAYNDKRLVMGDGVESLAYGHIKKMSREVGIHIQKAAEHAGIEADSWGDLFTKFDYDKAHVSMLVTRCKQTMAELGDFDHEMVANALQTLSDGALVEKCRQLTMQDALFKAQRFVNKPMQHVLNGACVPSPDNWVRSYIEHTTPWTPTV